MRAILCKSLVDRLKPETKPYEIRDTRIGGLLIRVQPSGVMTYYLQIGRSRRIKIGRASVEIDVVREIALNHLSDLAKGKDPQRLQMEVNGHTFLSFLENQYRPWAESHIKTAADLLKRLRTNFKRFHRRRLTHVTAQRFEEWRQSRLKKGKSRHVVNRDLSDLRAVLSKAVQWGYLRFNPLIGIPKLVTDRARIWRFLSPGEETQLHALLIAREAEIRRARERANAWRTDRGYPLLPTLHNHAFADHLRPMVIVALNSGMRRAELFDLHWIDVNLAQRFITVRGEKTKSHQTRHIPLNDTSWKCLNDWRAQCADEAALVFPAADGGRLRTVSTAWRGVLAKAKIVKFRWHDMRHTFASRLVMRGVDLNTVRELLGHADCQMTLRYAHLAPEYKAEAVERLVA